MIRQSNAATPSDDGSNKVRALIHTDIHVIACLLFDRQVPPAAIASFKERLVDSPATLQSVEVTGTFDLMLEVEMRDAAAYELWLDSLAHSLATLVARFEVNFVRKRLVRETLDEQDIWVPDADRIKRLDCKSIDKITAEGDYMRIHCGAESWLLHATMRSMAARLNPTEFIQLHRSALVRCGFIEQLSHEHRIWVARLGDGSHERVARGRVGALLQMIRAHWSKPAPLSSKVGHAVVSSATL